MTQRVLIAGATGMVGGAAMRLALEDPGIIQVTTLGRRKTGVEHPKLREIEHADFLDFGPVMEAFANQSCALFCLGAYTGALSDEEFRKVTVDYAVRFGEALHRQSPKASFCLLSGQGADPSGKASAAFARFKGEAEKALLEVGFPRVHLFRPGYIYPVEPRREPNLGYSIFRLLYPLLRMIYPNVGVPSEDLAWAMLYAGLYGTPEHASPILENADIRAYAATKGP